MCKFTVTAHNPYEEGSLEHIAFREKLADINSSPRFWVSDWRWLTQKLPLAAYERLSAFSGDEWAKMSPELSVKFREELAKLTGAQFHEKD